MQEVARETWVAFERRLDRAGVPARQRLDYHKWIRFYLDFCHKYNQPPRSATSLGPFLNKLAARNQSLQQRHQAAEAISLLLGEQAGLGVRQSAQTGKGLARTAARPGGQSQPIAPPPLAAERRPMPVAQAGPPRPAPGTGPPPLT